MPKLPRVDPDTLIALRTEKGWSTRDLAEQAVVGLATVQRAERGERVKYETLSKLASALGVSTAQIQGVEYQWDVFISHASEDKQVFVERLTQSLARQGLKVWYDASVLEIGDDLQESITEGIRMTEFGIVILSHKYFEKDWTKKELTILLEQRSRKILPIRFGVSAEYVSRVSPELAAVLSAEGSLHNIEDIVERVVKAIGLEYKPPLVYRRGYDAPPDSRKVRDWKFGRKIALFIFLVLACALASALSVKITTKDQPVIISQISDFGGWLGSCGEGIGIVISLWLAIRNLPFIIQDNGCLTLPFVPIAGAILSMMVFFLIGSLVGAVLFLFEMTFTMDKSTQFIASSLIGAASGLLFFLGLQRFERRI